jgi:hypothetical protein
MSAPVASAPIAAPIEHAPPTEDAPPSKKARHEEPSGLPTVGGVKKWKWPHRNTSFSLSLLDGSVLEHFMIMARSELGEDGYMWWYTATEEEWVYADDSEKKVWEVKCAFRGDAARDEMFAHIREHVTPSSVPDEDEWESVEHDTPGISAQIIDFDSL